MSSSPERNGAGFTLLECMVAVLVLNLVVLGMIQLVKGHQEVLDGVDDWTYGDPVLHVVQDPDPLARALGVPATLAVDPGMTIHVPAEGPYEVTVTKVWRELDPPRTTAVFEQNVAEKKEAPKKKEGEKEEKKEKKKEEKSKGEEEER